jgi:hypothetical protein
MKCQIHVPVALPPGRSPGTHWIEVCVGSTAALDIAEKEECVLHLDGIEPQFLLCPGCSLAYIQTQLSQVTSENLLATGSAIGIQFSVRERNFLFVTRSRQCPWPAQISLQYDSNS